MLIVFQSVNVFSIFPAFILGLFTEVYYLRLTGKICNSRTFKKIFKFFNLRPLPLEDKKHLNGIRYYDYGFEDIVHGQAESMLPMSMMWNLDKYFKNISKLENKLRLSLANSFNYHGVGTVALYVNSEATTKSVYIIHTNLGSYFYRESGVKGAERFHHLLLPADDFEKLWVKGKFLILKLLQKCRKALSHDISEANHEKPSVQSTAVFYHHSINFGQMFRKLHYFSSDPKSKLNSAQVSCFVLNRFELFPKTTLNDAPILIDMVSTSTIKDIFGSVSFLISRLHNVRSLKELSGLLFISKFYYSYRTWCVTLLQYPSLKNVIIDYDILFPKSLALALETCNIRTIALQERGSISLSSNYGSIVDTYLFAGGVFTKFGVRNKSIAFRSPVNFGQWRTSLFYSEDLPEFNEMSFIGFNKKEVRDFSTVICCLGWFTDQENSSVAPILSIKSSLAFYSLVKSLALSFNNSAVILRMKLLSDYDKNIIFDYFYDLGNVFLCDEYSKMNASYSLCKKADVIVSVQTSLAEESLAVGKKVVLFNSTHNFKNICTDIYPQDFHFAIADDLDQIIALVIRCMQEDPELSAKYEELRGKLTGDFDLSVKNMIPDTLEKYLQ
jgi:hypothetical protein